MPERAHDTREMEQRAENMVGWRVQISDLDPFVPGAVGTVESGRDHYVVVKLDVGQRRRGHEKTTVHDKSVSVIRRGEGS